MAKPVGQQYLPVKLIPPASQSLNDVSDTVATDNIKALSIQAIIDGMLAIAKGEQGNPDRPTLVGLAAPQVGVNKRIIIVGVNADGQGGAIDFRIYINPEIVNPSQTTNFDREGCYSTDRVCGIVERADQITVKALNRTGKPVSETYSGFPARIFQHEIDHLNGLRFPDRITDDQNLLWVEPENFGDFREQWASWPHKCLRSKWLAIKSGVDTQSN